MSESQEPREPLKELIWFVLGASIFADVAIGLYGFIQLWRGDWRTFTWIVARVSLLILAVTLGYLAFSSKASLIKPLREKPRRTPRYPRLYKPARIGLIALAVFTIAAGVLLHWHDRIRQEKVIVLVADFSGPDPERYRVTEQVLAQLGNSLAGYDDTLIEPLGGTITEQQGSEEARAQGKRYRADLVLWGWYGVTGSDVLLTVHVENLTGSEYIPRSVSETYTPQAALAEIESFKIQQRLSGEMSALTLFVSGVVRFEAEDYPEAIRRLSDALEAGGWPGGLLDQDVAFFYRGVAHAFLGDHQQAIADYSQAIQIDPQLTEAYNNRGLAYSDLGNYEWAIAEYSRAIEIDPQFAPAYNNRGLAYGFLGDYQQAIADCSQAIEIDPQLAPAYNNRGNAHLSLGEYEQAIADYTQAIQIDPQNAEAYYNRGAIHFTLGEYEQAIADLRKVLELSSDPELRSNAEEKLRELGAEP